MMCAQPERVMHESCVVGTTVSERVFMQNAEVMSRKEVVVRFMCPDKSTEETNEPEDRARRHKKPDWIIGNAFRSKFDHSCPSRTSCCHDLETYSSLSED